VEKKRPEYIELDTSKPSYIRKDRLSEIASIDLTVFDCDGVLLDVRRSYNKAVTKTTIMIVEAFTGTTLPEALFDGPLNFKYKLTGGFNNDWTHTYAYIMRILAEIDEESLIEINRLAGESQNYEKPADRYYYIKGKLDIPIPLDGLYEKLGEFASKLDSTGIESVDRELLEIVGPKVKETLRFSADVGDSMVSTLFEELFCGKELFTENFGFSPTFVEVEKGIVEDEDVVVKESTIDKFEELFGGPRFGIASGSLANTARHALGDILNRFPEQSQIWHDVVDEFMEELGQVGLHKPNKFPLMKAAEFYRPFKQGLYVGDTMADFLTAEKAGEEFLFAGVYACVHQSEGAMKAFLDMGSDIVAPDVNYLPMVIEYVREIRN
jgi:phosphoglycolate phosphatase-like HAD superfamily hydrolase